MSNTNTIDLIIQIIDKYIKKTDTSKETLVILKQLQHDILETIDISKKLNTLENKKFDINKEYKNKIGEYEKDLNILQKNCRHYIFEKFVDPASAEINYKCSICHGKLYENSN